MLTEKMYESECLYVQCANVCLLIIALAQMTRVKVFHGRACQSRGTLENALKSIESNVSSKGEARGKQNFCQSTLQCSC